MDLFCHIHHQNAHLKQKHCSKIPMYIYSVSYNLITYVKLVKFYKSVLRVQEISRGTREENNCYRQQKGAFHGITSRPNVIRFILNGNASNKIGWWHTSLIQSLLTIIESDVVFCIVTEWSGHHYKILKLIIIISCNSDAIYSNND